MKKVLRCLESPSKIQGVPVYPCRHAFLRKNRSHAHVLTEEPDECEDLLVSLDVLIKLFATYLGQIAPFSV